MTTDQARQALSAFDTSRPSPAAGLRELQPHELLQVSGGLPHKSWELGEPVPAAATAREPLPHGSW
jgi:hypothetical protein